jgi:hypothetical protein
MISGTMLLNRPRYRRSKNKPKRSKAKRSSSLLSLLKIHRKAQKRYPKMFNRPSTWIPAFGAPMVSNPRSAFEAVKAGFRPSVLLNEALPVAAGAIANRILSEKTASYLPVQWQSGWRAAIISAGTAGVLGGLASMASRRIGGRVFAGALMQTVATLIYPILRGMEEKLTPSVVASPVPAGTKGMGEGHHPWVPAFARGMSGGEHYAPEMSAPLEMS